MRDFLIYYLVLAGVASAVIFAYLYRRFRRQRLDQIAQLFLIAMFGALVVSFVALLLALRLI